MSDWRQRVPFTVALGIVALFLFGARRPDGGCGADPRRYESAVGFRGELRFERVRTATHSVGRSVVFTSGTFSEPSGGGVWFGDDHSRLVLFEDPLPLRGGRVSSGRWAEYAWGEPTGFFGTGNFIVPRGFTTASTVRSVDIGFCSQRQAWSNDAGTGIGDVATGALCANVA